MPALYNEIDPYAAQWLRNLIAAGHIAPGVVDERSIAELTPADLDGYEQVHFFAGIGGWSLALRLAGWPDDRPVWTGSCPCQGFSAAGKGAGFDDPRHLWPDWFRLIRECRPATVFGEQVASPLALSWLDLVHADMEGAGYAVAANDICAAGIGAPHIRQRLWFVADAGGERRDGQQVRLFERGSQQAGIETAGFGDAGELADAGSEGSRRHARAIPGAQGEGAGERRATRCLADEPVADGADGRPGPTNGFWRDADWLRCRDGKWRPVEPGTFPLAHGIPARVGRLRAYGNAIVPQVAAEFIAAYLDTQISGLEP